MSLARGAFIQLNVIHALILRETRTRFGEHQLGYLWALIEPLLWIGSFWALYEVGSRPVTHNLELVGFLATGVLTYEIFDSNVGRVGDSINGNRPLLFYPPVQPLDLVLARASLETATLSAVFVVVMGAAAMLRGEIPHVDSLLRVMGGITLAAGLGTSLGLLLCMLGVLSNVVERLRGPVLRPLFWVSGLFYTLDDVPPGVRELFLYNPILHVVELVRDGWFPEYNAPQADPVYVLWFILAFALVGLLLERVVRRKIELS
jgi:capsular polysaccharide transport system permease protein